MTLRFVTVDEFTTTVGLDEVAQIAGIGSFNDPGGRTLDLAKIGDAIRFAGDLLISHARARYPAIEEITVAKTPELVKGLICDVARYRLRSRSGGQGQVSEEVRKRFEDAIAFFKQVARGEAELPLKNHPIDGEVAAGVKASVPPGRAGAILEGW